MTKNKQHTLYRVTWKRAAFFSADIVVPASMDPDIYVNALARSGDSDVLLR